MDGVPAPRLGVARAAVLWCALFAGLHLFWALGGSLGLASSAGADLATRRPTGFVAFGLYGVALLLLLGVALLAGLLRARASDPRRRVLAALVAVIGVVLLVRGCVVEALLALDVGGARDAVGPLETRWSLILWNPWFALGGALFLAVAMTSRWRRLPARTS